MRGFACICAVLALCVMGCTKDDVPVITVVEAEPPALPAECTAPDAAWQKLPDGDVTRAQAVKNYDANKRQYSRIITRRSVCRAAINALNSKG